ncbi:hypothetical protein G7Y79_00003g010590 [Physcia stellaris]|nr:hypothetical protein G7Y79_00003g010590 [Physcia stellaris]
MADIDDAAFPAQYQDHKALFASIARQVLPDTRSDMNLTICRAYDSGSYSDLTIQCGTRTWKVHRLIVYAASNYFFKAGEGDFKEGQTKHIHLQEMDPDILDKVLSYIYKHDYATDAKSAITTHPEVYKLADYLDMQPLKQTVRRKFHDALKADWEVVAFTKALRAVYTNTPPTDRGLRDVAKAHLGLHKKTLRGHKGFTDLLESNFADGRFVMDVLDAFTEYKDAKPAVIAAAAAGVVKKKARVPKAERNQDQS